MYTNEQVRELAQAYLEHGDFTVSGYARIEKAGVEYLAEAVDLEQETIDHNMNRAGDEFECLSDWAYELAVATPLLDKSEIYVLRTLDLGTSEQRTRFVSEFRGTERLRFVALWMEIGDLDSLVASVPEAAGYAMAPIDAARAGQQFGVPRATLTLACREGHIAGAMMRGNRWEFPLASFLKWLNKRNATKMKKHEVINPERCEECGEFATWQVVIDDSDHYFCEDCLPNVSHVGTDLLTML